MNNIFNKHRKLNIAFVLLLFSSTNLFAQVLSIDAGYMVNTGSIIISEDLSLKVDGNLNSKGGSTIIFGGNDAQYIYGTGTAGFNNIKMQNSSTGMSLQKDISVNGDITMTDGDLDLLDNTLSLGQNGDIIGENVNSMIKSTSGNGSYTPGADAGDGQIVRTMDITTAGVSNAGGEGIDITPTTNWGSCDISRQHQRVVGIDGDNSVFRTYVITPTNGANLAATISIKYQNNELNGNTGGSLKMYQLKSNGAKGTEWEELSSTDDGSEVTASTIDNDLSEVTITLAGASETLPVSLISYTANCDNNAASLSWSTASEINNDYFIIEKSSDGFIFEEVAQIKGGGNSNQLINYQYLDINENQGLTYYRLVQVDYDGKTETFNPIVVDCSTKNNFNFIVVNPVVGDLSVYLNGDMTEIVDLQIIDMTGKTVLIKSLQAQQNQWNYSVSNLSPGVYKVIFSGNNFYQSNSVVILKN